MLRWNSHTGTVTGVTLEQRQVLRWNSHTGTATGVTLEQRQVLRWNSDAGTATECLHIPLEQRQSNFSVKWFCHTKDPGSIPTGDR